MSPRPRRAVALALLALMLLPGAFAQAQLPDPTDPDGAVDTAQPDLVPSNPTVTTTDEREPTEICTNVLNAGQGRTAVPFRVLLRVNGFDHGEKRVDETFSQGQGTSTPLCWKLQLAAGWHNYTVFVDNQQEVAESNETNNLLRDRAFRVAGPPRIDLELVRLDVVPRVGQPSSNQAFVVRVANRGGLDAPATLVELRDENGVIARLPVKALVVGESIQVAHVTRPDLRPAGRFIATATVDPDNAIREIDEHNNDAIFEYEVAEHPAPDLAISAVNVSSNLTARRGIRIEATVPNLGDRHAFNVVVRVLDENDVSLGNATRGALEPGTNATIEFFLVLPGGNHTLRIVADPDRAIVERDETNNVAWLNLTVETPVHEEPTPNLVVTRLDLQPSDPAPDRPVLVIATIRNAGDNRSGPTTVNFSVGGELVTTARINALAPGAYATADFFWSGGPTGIHRITARVDPLALVKELSEEDNALNVDVVVYERPPPERPSDNPPTGGNATRPDNETPTPGPTPTPTPTPSPGPTPPLTGNRVVVSDLTIGTRAVPGGVKGLFIASLRNPSIEPLGRLSVTFSVDGKVLKEVLVNGVAGAGTATAQSGELDLPGGNHTVTVQVRVLGSNEPPQTLSRTYDVEAGESGFSVPGPGAPLALAAAALGALALSRRRRGRAGP